MFKCYHCGWEFEEGEEARWSESRGEAGGAPCYEKMVGCPNCGGGFEEMVRCKICGEYYLDEELTCDVCDECIDECRGDVDICMSVGNNYKFEVSINSFLAMMFDEKQIEEILLKELKLTNNVKKVDCSPFIDEDKYQFAEYLQKEVNGNEDSQG